MAESTANGWFLKSLVTGGWVIEDLRIRVPDDRATWVTADQHNSSTDLHRGVSQRLIYKFTYGDIYQALPPQQDNGVRQQLQAALDEVAKLATENDRLRSEIGGLRIALQSLKSAPPPATAPDVSAVLTPDLMANLAAQISAQINLRAPLGTMVPEPQQASPQLPGSSVPMFIPDTFGADQADVQIQVNTQKTDSSAVQSAGNKLKSLRKKDG